jgi:hypothetical protein
MATPDQVKSSTQVIFSTDVNNMDRWAQRTRIPLTTADALGAPYAKAHKWLNSLKSTLVHEYKWSQVPSDDPRILFTLETPSIRKSSVNLPAGPNLKLELPVHATSFFTPERRVQWEMVFHSDTFESVRKICPPINDILYLLQCLLTGLVTVVLEEMIDGRFYRTTRGLPPVKWFSANEGLLADIFDPSHLRALRKACNDTSKAYHLKIMSENSQSSPPSPIF